ncbi:MAG: NADH/ubiquinone/plastoquinone, partial [Halanaerobium sp. T82-1]
MWELMLRNFSLNNTNILFLSTGLLVSLFTSLSSWRKIEKYRFLFHLIILIFSISFSLVITTTNWFIFMIGWEIITLSTSLILGWSDKNIAWEYFVIQFIGGSFLILTVLIAYTNGYQIIEAVDEFWLQLMFIIGLGVK